MYLRKEFAIHLFYIRFRKGTMFRSTCEGMGKMIR